MNQPAVILFILGDETPDNLAALRARLLGFYLQDGDRPLPLHRCLGSGGPRAGRAALRRKYLQRAAAMLPGPSSWARCQQLAEACRTFEVRRFPAWRKLKLESPPDYASELDRVLWAARQFGELACTPQAYISLLVSET